MAFIIDKDQQQNLQQVVAPAAPADAAPTSSAHPLDDVQFAALLNVMKNYKSTNIFVDVWKNYAFDPSVAQFETLRQQIRDKFDAVITSSMFTDPMTIAKTVAAGIRLTDRNDPAYIAAQGDFNTEDEKIQAFAAMGTAQGFETQINKVLDAPTTSKSLTEEFRTRLLAYATKQLAAVSIPADNQHAMDFLLNNLQASGFGLSAFGWTDITATLKAAPIWRLGFEGLCIDDAKWSDWADAEAVKTGNPYVDKMLLKVKLSVANDEIHALGTLDSIDFDTLNKIMAIANPTSNDVNGLFKTNNGTSLVSILNKYGINTRLRITKTVSTVDARTKTLHLTIDYLYDPMTVGVPFSLFNGDITAKLTIPVIQQAREALAKIIGSVQISKPTLHEKDLLDAGLFSALSTEERIRNVNGNFGWQEVSVEGFRTLTGFDLSTVDKAGLHFGTDGDFDFKLFVRKVGGRFEYTSVLIGGTIPASQNTPAAPTLAANIIQSPVMKTGNTFVSYQDIIRAAIGARAIGYTHNAWLEQLLDGSGDFAMTLSAAFITAHTNFQEVRDYIVKMLEDAGASSSDIASRWTFANPTLTFKASEPLSGKYTFEYSVTDNALTRPGFTSTVTSSRDINPPRAFETHTFSDGAKTASFYSVFDPAHKTDISSDVSLIEAPDKAPFDHPETFTGDIPYDELIWDGKTFNDLIAALKARGIDFVNVPTKFIDYTNEKATYSYRHNPTEPRMGGVFTFTADIVNAAGQTETKTVSVFIVLESKPATQSEKDAAKKEVQETADQANDAINLALNYGQKIDNVDQLRLKITEIVNKFNQDVDSNPTITEPKLHTLKMHAKAQIMDIVKDLITSIDLDALIGKLAPLLYPHLSQEQAIATLLNDPHLMEIIRKYPGVIQKLVNIKPPLSKDVLEFILKNKNLLEMFSNFIENTPEGVINKVVNGLQKTSDNYKYGYFGAGAALGLAGLGGAAATVGTVSAAKKAKKVTTHKIKIRSNKLISFITGGISLLAMGGSAALLILFFMKQGGF